MGMVITSNCVHSLGQCFVDFILLQMVVRASIMCSSPALSISAVMIWTPVDFLSLNNLTAASTSSQRVVKSSSIAGWAVCEYCWVASCIISIEFHAVFCPTFYNVPMVSQRPPIFILDAADPSLLCILQFPDCLLHPSHFIYCHIIFHLSVLVLDPVFFSCLISSLFLCESFCTV